MKKIIYYIGVILLLAIIPSMIFAKSKMNFSFSQEASLLNITVTKGEEFTVELNGKGWYANRYSRDKITILLRTVDVDRTIFNIRANEAGEAYVFFSFVGKDKYLHITIKEKSQSKVKVSGSEVEDIERSGVPEKIENNQKGNKSTEPNKEIKTKEINLAEATSNALSQISKTEIVETDNKKVEVVSTTKNDAVNKIEVEKEEKTNGGISGIPEKAQGALSVEASKAKKENSKSTATASLNVKKSVNEKTKQNMLQNTPKYANNEKSKSIKPAESYQLAKKKKSSEIYYIDTKSKKKVEIKVEDENKNYFKGITKLKKGDNEGAIDLLKEYLAKCEKCDYREDAEYSMAKAYENLGDDDTALRYYTEIESKGKGKYYVLALRWLADHYYEKSDLKKALEFYKKVFDKTSDPLVKRRIADIAYSNEDISSSLEGYNYCVEKGVMDDEILFRLASIYDNPGKYRNIEKAYKFYRKIVESYPKSRYFDISERRVSFFEKNFINFR